MNTNSFVAYAVAGGIILLAGNIVPDIALASMSLIFLAVVLTHSQQLVAAGQFIKKGTGT